jgi:hypothetical protein
MLVLLEVQWFPVHAQGTAFSYNGQLSGGGGPVTGRYDLTFTIFNASTNGLPVAGPLTNNATAVANGLFNVALDFGPGLFTGGSYWLEVGVRTNGNGCFTTLAPRQPILATPYAVMANSASNLLGTVSAAQLGGTIANGNLPASPHFSGTVSAGAFTGNGSGLTGLSASQLTGTISPSALPGNLLFNGSSNVGFMSSFFVTNTGGPEGDNDGLGIWGIKDAYYNAKEICNVELYGGPDAWSADPQEYSDYTATFNEDVAAGSPIGAAGLSQYIWNTHILSLAGDNRSSVGVITTFGTNAEYGDIIEFLPRKSTHASINSGLFAHPLRLDGYGRVMVGNVPESEHTRFYVGSAYLDLWTGGNSDVPAMLFEQDGLSAAPVTGALERNNGLPYWTDGSLNRSPLLLSGHSGDGGNLTNLNANAIANGLTTNIVVATPTGTATLFFTNGILRAVGN